MTLLQKRKEAFDLFLKKLSLESFCEEVQYKYRNIFNYCHFDIGVLKRKVKLLKLMDQFFFSKQDHPGIEMPLESMDVYDYLAITLFKEADKSINFELYYTDEKGQTYPLSKMNSGRKYILVLKCLKSVYKDDRDHKTVIIVDEPENSLHLSSLIEIIESEDENCVCWVATHSPAYAKSLISVNRNDDENEETPENDVVLHIATKQENVLKEEICNDKILPDLSLDTIAADFFSYSPFIEKFEQLNRHIDERNMISIDEFYRQLNELRGN